jgi:MFS family permease
MTVDQQPNQPPSAAKAHQDRMNEMPKWRTIGLLTAVSTFAQVGQFGIAFLLYPLALTVRQCTGWQIGLVSGSLWAGMALGLLAAPLLVRRFGHDRVVLAGLMISVIALLLTPLLPWVIWLVTALAMGLGFGLRWIGNETWLYAILPQSSRGRLVGLHEMLIGISAVVGPALISLLGSGSRSFMAAALFTSSAALPLLLARSDRVAVPESPTLTQPLPYSWLAGLARPGSLIAGLGGAMEGAVLGLFGRFGQEHGLAPDQLAWMLSILGGGAMLMQWPLGWLADHLGLRRTSWAAIGLTAGCAALLLCRPGQPWLAVGVFLLGGALAGYLTLGMVAATAGLDDADMATEVGRVSLAYSAMSAIGPVAAGIMMSLAGGEALMWLVLVLCATLSLRLRTAFNRH